ncbi:MAG: TetR/AcrR family transcriptional regulator [Actinomycetota bacterium]|nr:TetR/AcrR family transcriptional regulator [Actinomycetota bacterium]
MSERGHTSGRRPGRPRNTEPSPEYVARMNQIVETAAKVFQAKGYDAGSLDDVAVALDLRKASLYYYVRSKAELLYRVFDRAITTALDNVQCCQEIDDPRERLAALIRLQAVSVALSPGYFTVFFDQRPRLSPDYEADIRSKERRYLRVFAEAVDAAVAAGVLPAVDPRFGAQAILGMTSWVYKWFDGERDDPEAFARTCAELLLGGGGVAAPAGVASSGSPARKAPASA